MTTRFDSLRILTLCSVLGPAVMACTGEAAAPDEDVGSGKSFLFLEDGVSLWNGNRFGTGASVPVCMSVRPFVGLGGGVDCPSQRTDSDCNGESRAGQSLPAKIKSQIAGNNCLVLDSSGTVVVDACGGDPTQWIWIKWRTDGGALMAASTRDGAQGQCLTVDTGGTGKHKKVILDACDAADGTRVDDDQFWMLQADGSLKNLASNQCLDLPSATVGRQMQIYECHGGANQRWSMKNPKDGTLYSKSDVRDGIRRILEERWSRMTQVSFTGFGDCAIGDGNKHQAESLTGVVVRLIQAGTPGGDVQAYYPIGKPVKGPVVVQLPWNDIMDGYGEDSVVHEFGHALGFDHEWFRADWPYRVGVKGGKFRSAVAKGSHCLQSTSGSSKVELAPCAGATDWSWEDWSDDYSSGEYCGGELKSNGQCLTVAKGGTLVDMETCNEKDAQLWVIDIAGSLRNPVSQKCLEVKGGSVTGAIQINDCTGGDNQRWNSSSGMTFGTPPDTVSQWQYNVFRVFAMTSQVTGKDCLEVDASNAAITASCSGSETHWRFEKWDDLHTGSSSCDGSIEGTLMLYQGEQPTNQCLEVTGSGTSPGTTVRVSSCVRSDGQLWRWRQPDYSGTTTLENPHSALCLDVPWSNIGAQLQIDYCSGGHTQLWQMNERWPLFSTWDVVGIHNAYGRKAAGSVVGPQGRCVTIPDPTMGPGQPLQVFGCQGTNQQWTHDASGHLLTPSFPQWSWDVAGGLRAGGRLQLDWRDEPASAEQQWSFKATAIRAMGDTCVGVPDNDFHDGAPLEIETCTRAAQQQWDVLMRGLAAGETTVTIEHGSTCWVVPSGLASPGEAVQIAGCNDQPRQRFTLTAKGQIAFTAGGVTQCVEVADAVPMPGKTLLLGPCKSDTDFGRQNQLYYLKGPIQVGDNSGLCLELPNGASFDGAPLQIASCTGGDNQEWDYYFGPPVTCSSNADCDDGNPCTSESCSGGACDRTAVAPGTACTDDGNRCTNDVCSAAGQCTHPSNGTCNGPCGAVCANPTNLWWTGNNYRAWDLGTGPLCIQTYHPIADGNCGNLAAGRDFKVNGVRMSCTGANWGWVPPKVDGGYCLSMNSGDWPWVFFTLW